MFLYYKYQGNDSLGQLISDFKSGRLKGSKGTIEFESRGAKADARDLYYCRIVYFFYQLKDRGMENYGHEI